MYQLRTAIEKFDFPSFAPFNPDNFRKSFLKN